jgi:hypothetical protein
MLNKILMGVTAILVGVLVGLLLSGTSGCGGTGGTDTYDVDAGSDSDSDVDTDANSQAMWRCLICNE